MAFTDDVLAGVAQYLEDGAVGTWTAAGAYVPTDVTPIVILSVPGTPDQVIVLAPYVVSDSISLSDSVLGLQVRLRGTRDPRSVQTLADTVYDRLHGAWGIPLVTGGRLVLAERKSGTPLGTDGGGRHQRSENYELTVWRPSQHRL